MNVKTGVIAWALLLLGTLGAIGCGLGPNTPPPEATSQSDSDGTNVGANTDSGGPTAEPTDNNSGLTDTNTVLTDPDTGTSGPYKSLDWNCLICDNNPR